MSNLLGCVEIIVSGTVLVMLSPFCWYHIKITSIGQTTNEYQNRVFSSCINPFDRGLIHNCMTTCYSSLPVSEVGDLHRICTAQDYLNANCDRIQLQELLTTAAYHPPSYNSIRDGLTLSEKVFTSPVKALTTSTRSFSPSACEMNPSNDSTNSSHSVDVEDQIE